ncbi:MAG: excisionase family DNA-binding protein [Candidatus Zixiibacteriota bacterium]
MSRPSINRRSPIAEARSDLLSTGEAAALCRVTSDTVLKWIRSGKIEALRTPGGHHRVPRSALAPVLEGRPVTLPTPDSPARFQYCWEFNSTDGRIPDGCRECIVYRSGTLRCYELHDLPAQAGYVGLFCKGSCQECDYYARVVGQRPNVLVVSNRDAFTTRMREGIDPSRFNLKVTDCEYRCSMCVEEFRPDYMVIDCSLGAERSLEFARLIYEDPRIPFVRIILVGKRSDLPDECDRLVFAVVDSSFDASTLMALIAGSRRQAQSSSGDSHLSTH